VQLHHLIKWPLENIRFRAENIRTGSFQLPVLLQMLEDLLLSVTNIRAESQEDCLQKKCKYMCTSQLNKMNSGKNAE